MEYKTSTVELSSIKQTLKCSFNNKTQNGCRVILGDLLKWLAFLVLPSQQQRWRLNSTNKRTNDDDDVDKNSTRKNKNKEKKNYYCQFQTCGNILIICFVRFCQW